MADLSVPVPVPVVKESRKYNLSERHLIRLAFAGDWEIDDCGRIWIMRERSADGRSVPCQPRRAEYPSKIGYLFVRAGIGGERFQCAAHRLVWQYFHGDIPQGLTINHINGIKTDNSPSNLEVVTLSENISHAHATQLRSSAGDSNGNSKLTPEQVIEIRASKGSVTAMQLAEKYGVSIKTIGAIHQGRLWKCLLPKESS